MQKKVEDFKPESFREGIFLLTGTLKHEPMQKYLLQRCLLTANKAEMDLRINTVTKAYQQ